MKYKTFKELTIRKSRFLFYKILKTKRYSIDQSIIIFSEPRGGSTWLMEILNHLPKTAINWEPFHDKLGVVPKTPNWSIRPYWSIDSKQEENFKIVKSILDFSRFNSWTLAISPLNELLKADTIITKFVRGNAILPWIINNFEFKNKPILLVRNPIDTCISQMKSFGKIDYNKIKEFYIQRYPKHKLFLESLNTELELRIAIWILNNIEVLNYPNIREKVLTVFYEDLMLNPETMVENILTELKIADKDKESTLKEINYRQASVMNVGGLKESTEDQLWKNMKKLKDEELRSIQQVYNYFEFDLYSVNSPFKFDKSEIYMNLVPKTNKQID